MKVHSRVANWFAICVSVAMVLSSLAFFYISFAPIDVLKDWTLTLDKSEYAPGETFVVHTNFKKVRSVSGISKRYVVCTTDNGSKNRFPLPEADADRPIQSGTSDIYLRMSTDIPNLPATCQLEIIIEYNIYAFRKHREINQTKEFTVTANTDESNNAPTGTDNDNEVVENTPKLPKSNASIPSFITPYITVTPSQENSPLVPPQPEAAININLPLLEPNICVGKIVCIK